jgi:hypothetical protein
MVDGSGRSRLVALLGRVLRARINSYPQIWIVATVGYLACTAGFWFVGGGLRYGGARFAILGVSWLGVGTGMSLALQRRRDSVRVSEAKPLGRGPRSS